MAENSKIEWTDHTFNPWIGCTKVSPGCDGCYAEARMDKRLHRVQWGAGQPRVRTKTWGDPVKWNGEHKAFLALHGRRQRVFCASLADWLDNEVPIEWLVDLLDLIRCTPDLDWLLLTKRIGNWRKQLDLAATYRLASVYADGGDPLRDALWQWIKAWLDGHMPENVWLGATVVNQAEADRDIPKLLAVPARVRFLSIEPMLGPIDLSAFLWECCGEPQPSGVSYGGMDEILCCGRPLQRDALHWVIAGGESGPGARPMHPDWPRSLRDQCSAAGVPFLFKQWGEFVRTEIEYAEWLDPKPERLGEVLISKDGDRATVLRRIGKKAAGRLLDGRTHDEFPI